MHIAEHLTSVYPLVNYIDIYHCIDMSYQYNKQVPHGKPPDVAVAIAEHFLVAMK